MLYSAHIYNIIKKLLPIYILFLIIIVYIIYLLYFVIKNIV